MATPLASPHRASLESHLVAVGRGDGAAFVLVYDAVAPRVHGLVLRVLRDPAQAEEVTQEVALQVWQTASRFDPHRGSAISWVLTLAHRRAVDRVRSSRAERRRDEVSRSSEQHVAWDETASTAHAALDARQVQHAVGALSPLQREAIELAYFDGHTYREVATIVGAPLGTVKSRIRDGLYRLREAMLLTQAEPT